MRVTRLHQQIELNRGGDSPDSRPARCYSQMHHSMQVITTFIESGTLKKPMTSFSRASIAHARQTEILADEHILPWATHVHRWAHLGTYIIRCVLTSSMQYTNRTILYAAVEEINSLSSPTPIESCETGSERISPIWRPHQIDSLFSVRTRVVSAYRRSEKK